LVFEQRRKDVDNNINGFCYKRVTTVIYDRNYSGLGAYSRYFIFFITYEWFQQARGVVGGKPFQPSFI
jgi:hypothetical protein